VVVTRRIALLVGEVLGGVAATLSGVSAVVICAVPSSIPKKYHALEGSSTRLEADRGLRLAADPGAWVVPSTGEGSQIRVPRMAVSATALEAGDFRAAAS